MIGWDMEIRESSDKYDLPYGLVSAIIRVESNGDPWAIRYEPGFKSRYLDGKEWPTFGAISKDTEVVARATSWGLMQVMGQVARERGFTGAYLSELCQGRVGIEYGCRHLRHLWDRYFDKDGKDGVISAYNQGSPMRDVSGDFVNSQYVRKVRKIWA